MAKFVRVYSSLYYLFKGTCWEHNFTSWGYDALAEYLQEVDDSCGTETVYDDPCALACDFTELNGLRDVLRLLDETEENLIELIDAQCGSKYEDIHDAPEEEVSEALQQMIDEFENGDCVIAFNVYRDRHERIVADLLYRCF